MNAYKILQDFLKEYKVGKGEAYTNTSIGEPKQLLNIPAEKYDEFLKYYSACVKENKKQLHLTEKPIEISPLRIDLDFRFEFNKETDEIVIDDDNTKIARKYDKESIKNVVQEYFKIITETFDVPEKDMVAYLHEKPSPSKYRSLIKDGVHIIFPNICLSYNEQHYIRSKMLSNVVFNGIPFKNKVDDVVDNAIIDTNCWLLYGSNKLESHKYETTGIYSYSNEKMNEIEINSDIDFIKMCSMRTTKGNAIVKEAFKEVIGTYTPTKAKKNVVKENVFDTVLNLNKNYTTEDDLSLIKRLVNECLAYSRANNYNDWISLGWVLRNIDYRLLDTWIEFSKKGDNYKEGECEQLWNNMKDDNKGIGTLRWWAKTDDIIQYHKIIDEAVTPLVDVAIRSDGAHHDTAKVFAEVMKDKIVYDAKAYYYVDDKNIWKMDKEAKQIYQICANVVCGKFMERSQYYMSLKTDNQMMSGIYDEYAKKAVKIAYQLKNSSYVDSIQKQLKGLLYEEDFITKKLDANIHLLAFKNGVYDLSECKFRDIEPTDYICLNTDYDYNENIDKKYEDEVYELLKSLFATDEMFSYVLDVLTWVLFGANKFQEFYIFTGEGANGKSVLINLIKKALGKYATTLNATTFTKPSKGANETSEMYNCKGIRFATFEEPNEEDKLITSKIKEYTGDGIVKTRGLYNDPIEFRPQFTLIGACNDVPRFTTTEPATQRRLRVINFPFTFKDVPVNDTDKLIDRDLGDKIRDNICYSQAFMKILFANWIKVKDVSSLNAPDEVMALSKKVLDDCNVVLKFINEYYTIDKNKTDDIKDSDGEYVNQEWFIKSRDLYTKFQTETRSNMTETAFGTRLNGIGIPSKRLGSGNVKYMVRVGIKAL